MKWNEKQLSDIFNSLKGMLNKGDYHLYIETLETITMNLSEKQFDNAFNYFISRFNCKCIYNDKYAYLLKGIAQKLDEKQMNNALNCFMDKLNDKNEHQNIRIKCIQIFERVSNKCNEQQLDEVFNSSMDIFTDGNHNVHVRMECAELL
ncbi:hypothetical protein RFI_34148, partial [Reticulomyxa filosa]